MKECECIRLQNELINERFERRKVEIELSELKRKIRELIGRGKDEDVPQD